MATRGVPLAPRQSEDTDSGQTFTCPEGGCKLKVLGMPVGTPPGSDRRARHESFHRNVEAVIRKRSGTVRAEGFELFGEVGSSRMSVDTFGVIGAVRILTTFDADGRLRAWNATCAHRGSHAQVCADALDSMSIAAIRPGGGKRPTEGSDERAMAALIGSITADILLALAAIAVFWGLWRWGRRTSRRSGGRPARGPAPG